MENLRIKAQSHYDDFEDDPDQPKSSPSSLYCNSMVISVTKTAWQEKGLWKGSVGEEPSPASSSGTFSRLLKTTVHRKPDKVVLGHPQPHIVTLNLHQFQTDNGDSLGEDPDSWARLTF